MVALLKKFPWPDGQVSYRYIYNDVKFEAARSRQKKRWCCFRPPRFQFSENPPPEFSIFGNFTLPEFPEV